MSLHRNRQARPGQRKSRVVTPNIAIATPPASAAPTPAAASPADSVGPEETTEGKSPMGLALVVFGVPLGVLVLMMIIKRLIS